MANVAKVAVRFRHNGTPTFDPDPFAYSVTTFHVMKAASEPAITVAERGLIIFHTLAWWEADNGGFVNVKSAYPDMLSLMAVECRNILPTPSEPTITELLLPSDGTSATRGLYPPQVCHLLGLRSSVESRRTRGRMYLPAWEPGDTNYRATGFIDQDGRTDLGHIAAHLAYEIRQVEAGLEDGPFVLAVYSRVNVDPIPVTHFDIPNRVRTQRRLALRPNYSTHSLSTGDPA